MEKFWLPKILNKKGELLLWNKEIPKNYFDKIKVIKESGLSRIFYKNIYVTGSVVFKNLTKIEDSGLYYSFLGCIALNGSINFPELVSIGTGGMNGAFDGAKITSINFPKLKTISGASTFWAAFRKSRIKTISFPSLDEITVAGYNDCFEEAFSNCNLLTEIHFKASIKSRVEQLRGYSYKFGAPKATIYFDL